MANFEEAIEQAKEEGPGHPNEKTEQKQERTTTGDFPQRTDPLGQSADVGGNQQPVTQMMQGFAIWLGDKEGNELQFDADDQQHQKQMSELLTSMSKMIDMAREKAQQEGTEQSGQEEQTEETEKDFEAGSLIDQAVESISG